MSKFTDKNGKVLKVGDVLYSEESKCFRIQVVEILDGVARFVIAGFWDQVHYYDSSDIICGFYRPEGQRILQRCMPNTFWVKN